MPTASAAIFFRFLLKYGDRLPLNRHIPETATLFCGQRQAGNLMSVDLNGIGPGQVNTPRTTADKSSNQNTQAPTGEQSKAQSPAARGENVNLSNQAKNLNQLEQKLGEYPEMDDDRISQIRSALEDGSYKVDAEKLAQKMLDMDKSIFG
jgi:negative regulator of flagellin synthesis FlgM